MAPTPYKIHHIHKRAPNGITKAASCSLNAYLKFDCDESPHCVYNEYVATKLAQTLHVPMAFGVLTTTADGQAFASLEVDSPGIPLPNIHHKQYNLAAQRYPIGVAALVAFDIFIGNYDRAGNIKASLVTPHIDIFHGFDNSHCLLTIEEKAEDSISSLHLGEFIANYHPFYGHVQESLLLQWQDRILSLDDQYIAECCLMGRAFRSVTKDMQQDLTAALITRKTKLPQIIASNKGVIRPCP